MQAEVEIQEEWRPVTGYEGLYEVSDLGRIKSVKKIVARKGGASPYRTVPEHIMSPAKVNKKDNNFDLVVVLYKEGVQCSHSVGKLVATAFIQNPENLKRVAHIDGDKGNNKVSNLAWCNHSESIRKTKTIKNIKEELS